MPIYEFQCGERTLLRHRPGHERDLPVEINGQSYQRRTIPTRLSVGVGARAETMSQKTWKGYRDLEMKGQLQDRPGYLPAAQVKAALAMPETD